MAQGRKQTRLIRIALSAAALLAAGGVLWLETRPPSIAPGPGPVVSLPEVTSPPIVAEPPPKPPEQTAILPPPPVRPSDKGLPAWRRNAVSVAPDDGRPMIAIIIDDVGLDRRHSAEAVALPPPLTLSYLAYAEDLPEQTRAAKARGHELMLHIPMEPKGRQNPGPHALHVFDDDEAIARSVDWDLARLDGIVGANNHMGSRFTEFDHGMAIVIDHLAARGLFFLDSMTSAQSVGWKVAEEADIPAVKRDVFLDDVQTRAAINAQLAHTEAVARRTGQAIAIGHPHPATLAALRAWLPTVEARGFRLVPVSAVVLREQAREAREAD